MAKTKGQKKTLLEQYKELLKDNPDYILVDTDRVSMTEITELKNSLRESDALFFVVKNTLFKIAAQETDQPTQIQEISDATGVIVCGDDPTAAAKALREIQKEHEVMDTRFGVLFGEVSDSGKIDTLAQIPSREELLAKLVGTLNAPLSGFALVVSGNTRDFVHVLSEINKGKGDETENS